MKTLLTTLLVVTNGLPSLMLAQDPTVTSIEKKLSQRIEVIDRKPLQVREAFVQAMMGVMLPGGIELFRCGDSEPLVTIEQGSLLRSALDRIQLVRPELSLDPSSKDVINLLDSRVFDLLETNIHFLTLSDPTHSAGSIQEILNAPEVVTRKVALKLEETYTQIGLTAIPIPGTVQELPKPLKLTNVTVREALNVVAIRAASGHGVWVYEERGCSAAGERTFELRFAVE